MRPALLVMDVQRDIVDAVDDGGSGYLPRLRRAIDAARSAEIPVIYVVIAFRPPSRGRHAQQATRRHRGGRALRRR
ncbi:isochorismatase family protein [Streptomyces sp. KL116D]|uniref:isochorismatase family protein n=1 Tax=Streptomyces sp. KL116D TaxID=3045152 RepID=UPI0035591CBB